MDVEVQRCDSWAAIVARHLAQDRRFPPHSRASDKQFQRDEGARSKKIEDVRRVQRLPPIDFDVGWPNSDSALSLAQFLDPLVGKFRRRHCSQNADQAARIIIHQKQPAVIRQ